MMEEKKNLRSAILAVHFPIDGRDHFGVISPNLVLPGSDPGLRGRDNRRIHRGERDHGPRKLLLLRGT